jgi:hypothetical protein
LEDYTSPPSALKMEAVCSSETFVSTYKSTWHYKPEDQHRHLHHHKNLEFQILEMLVIISKTVIIHVNFPKHYRKKVYFKTNFPVVLYESQMWSVTLWEEHKLHVLENKVLRKCRGGEGKSYRLSWVIGKN